MESNLPTNELAQMSVANSGPSDYRVLSLEEAADFLHIHPVTLQRMAKSGEIPAGKPGRRWIFIEIDLITFIRAQYPQRVMQGDNKKVNVCHSSNVRTHQTGGSRLSKTENAYNKALGLLSE
jgi:excisionase family DNA binding protein